MKRHVYRNTRPELVIELKGERSLGRCYSESNWKITSMSKLTSEKIRELYRSGFLGMGQEFHILSKCDGTESYAGVDLVDCVVVDEDTNEVLSEQAINQYTGEPYTPIEMKYYVYNTITRCDSGD